VFFFLRLGCRQSTIENSAITTSVICLLPAELTETSLPEKLEINLTSVQHPLRSVDFMKNPSVFVHNGGISDELSADFSDQQFVILEPTNILQSSITNEMLGYDSRASINLSRPNLLELPFNVSVSSSNRMSITTNPFLLGLDQGDSLFLSSPEEIFFNATTPCTLTLVNPGSSGNTMLTPQLWPGNKTLELILQTPVSPATIDL